MAIAHHIMIASYNRVSAAASDLRGLLLILIRP
jgi:hypothetical protein